MEWFQQALSPQQVVAYLKRHKGLSEQTGMSLHHEMVCRLIYGDKAEGRRLPNLRDESDNHLIELAVAAGAETIITANKRDFADSELLFPALRIETAGEFLDQRKTIWAH